MSLGNDQLLRRMSHFPMTQLMRKHRNHFFLFALLNQCVVEHNLLLPWKAGEIRVAVRRARAAVDDLQLAERKGETCGEGLDGVFERAGLERGEFIEERHDPDGEDCDGENLDGEHEEPDVIEEFVTRFLDDVEEGAAKGNAKGDGQGLGFQEVFNEYCEGLLVEAELFFEDEVEVVRKGETEQGLGEEVGEDE